MNDKNFKKMDEEWMNKTEAIREKKVSDGMLKGFSVSVERRITLNRQAGEAATVKQTPVFKPVWASVAAVMILASLVVLRLPIHQAGSPVGSNFLTNTAFQPVELAQVIPGSVEDLQEEIEVLKELGVWDEIEDEALLGAQEIMDADLELTRSNTVFSGIA